MFPWDELLGSERNFGDFFSGGFSGVTREVQPLDPHRIACTKERSDIPEAADVVGENADAIFHVQDAIKKRPCMSAEANMQGA